MKAKKIYTAAAVVLLIILYITIFCFSAEDAESSSAVSSRVTKIFLHIYYKIMGSDSGNTGGVISGAGSDGTMFNYLESIVRKFAHFTEYMCVGFFSYSIVLLWYEPVWKGRFLVVGQLFVSAALDEFHQYFIPGRYASVKDVLIDVTGGVVGITFIIICMAIRKKWRSVRLRR